MAGEQIEGPRGAREGEFEKPSLFNRDSIDNVRVFVDEGKVVSRQQFYVREVSILGCRVRLGSIGGVNTLPEYRKRGFATELFDDCTDRMDADGADLMQVSGDRGLYRRGGCKRVGDVCYFRITKEDVPTSRDVDVRSYEEGSLAGVIEAYQREPVRFSRSLSEFALMTKRPAPFTQGKGEILTLHEGNRLVGYVLASTGDPWSIAMLSIGEEFPTFRQSYWEDKTAKDVPLTLGRVIEYAGMRTAILQSIGPMFARYGLEELNFFVPSHDTELVHLLKETGAQFTYNDSASGTFKMVNFLRFMQRLHPYMEERLNEEELESLHFEQTNGSPRSEDRFVVRLGNEELVTSDIEHLVFGTHEKEQPEIQGKKLASVIDRLFPVPLVWHGMNSI